MWSYLKNPQYIAKADSTLRYEWKNYATYSDSFESVVAWSAIALSTTFVRNGTYSALWADHSKNINVKKTVFPTDWSAFHHMSLWVYTEAPINESITAIFYAENDATNGTDYYLKNFRLNFTGWYEVKWNKTEFTKSRSPSWGNITSIVFR